MINDMGSKSLFWTNGFKQIFVSDDVNQLGITASYSATLAFSIRRISPTRNMGNEKTEFGICGTVDAVWRCSSCCCNMNLSVLW